MAGNSGSIPRENAGSAPTNARDGAPSTLLGALLYLAVGSLWIAGSDIALELYVPDARAVTGYQTIKGLLFVAISAVLFYVVVRMRTGAARPDVASMLQAAPLPEADGGHTGVGNLIHVIAITGVVLIIGAMVLLGYNIRDERRDAIASAQGNAQNLAQVIEVETEHVFYAVDVTLLGLNDAIMMVGSSGRQRQRDVHLLLQQRLSQLPLVATLFIVDRSGTVVHASDALPAASTDLSDRAFFTVQRDSPRHGLFIGPPLPGGPAGKAAFTVSRPWTGGDGRFQGAIVAALDPERLEKLYGSIDTGKHGAVLLALRDGTLLACGPRGNVEAGASLADRPAFREHLPRAEVGTFLDPGTGDGAGRIVSYRAVPGLPLVVAVELDKNEALATWLHGARVEVAVVLAFVMTMAVLMAILVAELRRRERLSARLADSERRYRLLFDLLPLPAFVRDTETLRFIAVNAAAMETYMYTRDEFSRLTTWDIRPPEDHARYRVKLAEMRGQVQRRRDHGQHRRKDGTVMQVEVSSFDLVFAGRPARLTVINDVTERIAAEKALRESEMRLQIITDNLPATIAYIDAGERYRYVNRTHEKWYGKASGACCGRTVREVIGEEFYALRKPVIDVVLAGQTTMMEARVRVPGPIEFAQWTYVPDVGAGNRVIGFYVFGYDITTRKRVEEELRLYVERLEALRKIDTSILEARYPAEIASTALEHLLRVVPYWGASVRVIDFARREASVLATRAGAGSTYTPAQTLTFDDYGPAGLAALEEGRAAIVHDMAALSHRSELIEGRYRLGMRSFVRMPLMIESTLVGVLNLTSDKANYFTSDHLDFMRTIGDHLALTLQGAILRERIQRQADELEERVTERTAQLAIANQELEAFSYSVSHDLRAPLRSINGFGKLLQDNNAAQLDDSGRGFLQRILGASERMGDLIDDLLSLSRIARVEMRLAQIDVSALATEVAADIAVAQCERQPAVSIAPNLSVNADRGLVRILLENLIGNACKYSGRAAHPRIEIGQAAHNGQMPYFVRDNGAGFDMAYANKLFGVFQRLHSQREFPGTGIGLATVRRIVHRHGGEVWGEGAVNEGATFYFTLGPSARS